MARQLTSTVAQIFCKDVRASIAFYRLLGLAVPEPPPDTAGRVALAFGLEAPADVDAMFDRLTTAGHPGPLPPYDAPWGHRYATVLDPDGNLTDLFAPLA